MAIRGKVSTENGDYHYQVVQYSFDGKLYSRGATWQKLDSARADYIRVKVTSVDDPDDVQYKTLYGPYIHRDVVENDLEFVLDDPEYSESVG